MPGAGTEHAVPDVPAWMIERRGQQETSRGGWGESAGETGTRLSWAEVWQGQGLGMGSRSQGSGARPGGESGALCGHLWKGDIVGVGETIGEGAIGRKR